jgi:hypothetical protein
MAKNAGPGLERDKLELPPGPQGAPTRKGRDVAR